MDNSVIVSVVAAVAAATVGVVMGRARGVDQVARRADSELKKLVDALSARAELLESENADLRLKVASLEAKVDELAHDLRIERAVSARFRKMSEEN